MKLPSFIRDPAVTLVGEHCYKTLVEDLDLTNVDCIKYSLSKGLGLGIVVGGSIVKVPQILTILSNRSVKGLSLSSYNLETIAYCIVLAYNFRQKNPFSTFGEIVFITLQNIIIATLILGYRKRTLLAIPTVAAFMGLLYSLCDKSLVPASMMSTLFAATIPISVASKVPQIIANYRNQSTGQLSVFTVLNYFLGSAARVFTTMTELDDPLVLGGNLLASVLNLVLVLQVLRYWPRKSVKTD